MQLPCHDIRARAANHVEKDVVRFGDESVVQDDDAYDVGFDHAPKTLFACS